jgi:hypothetical protein
MLYNNLVRLEGQGNPFLCKIATTQNSLVPNAGLTVVLNGSLLLSPAAQFFAKIVVFRECSTQDEKKI